MFGGNIARIEESRAPAKDVMNRGNVRMSRAENANREHIGYLATARDIGNIGLCPQCGGCLAH
jgi:hypothetical protein